MAELPALLQGRRGLLLGLAERNSLGFHCARTLRALGAEVALTYRPGRETDAARMAQELGCALHFPVEAQDERSLAAACQALEASWGRLDFLIHTLVHVPAGVLAQPLLALSQQDFSSIMDVTAYSLILACRCALPLLERSDSPRVVTLTSAAARLMTPNYHAVGIAKAALGSALLYLAQELGPRGILCNAVSFSLLPTAGAIRAVGAETASATHSYLARRAPTRVPLEFDHVTRAIAYLASPLCQNMTGETLTVDGGYSRTYLK